MTYVPLSQRSSQEVWAQAETYSRMARTARTPEAKRGLEVLAERLAALAVRLGAGEPLEGGERLTAAPAAPESE